MLEKIFPIEYDNDSSEKQFQPSNSIFPHNILRHIVRSIAYIFLIFFTLFFLHLQVIDCYFDHFTGTFYWRLDDLATWNDGRKTCLTLDNADIVSIHNYRNYSILANFLNYLLLANVRLLTQIKSIRNVK